MPSMGGEQFMRHCREIPGLDDIPVYLFTATPGASDKAAPRLGAAGSCPSRSDWSNCWRWSNDTRPPRSNMEMHLADAVA